MSTPLSKLALRPATADDASVILKFITDLAIYEKAEHEVVTSVEAIQQTLFGSDSTNHALIAELDSVPVGFAVYFFSYSTWLGKYGIYLEDLYVAPEHRGMGAGKALLKQLAKIAVEKDCGRVEWSVLDWNTPAIDFYDSIGEKPKSEWIGYRLDGDSLKAFAKS